MSHALLTGTCVFIDPDDESEVVMGDVSIANGQLAVLHTEPFAFEFLNELAQRLNSQPTIVVKVGGSQRYALESEVYYRNNHNFIDGLRQHLRQLYSIEIRSSSDFETRPDDFADLKA